MHQRVRAGRVAPVADGPAPAGRHCWVLDAADRHGVKRAGLLLEWRRSSTEGTWEGRVVYVAQLRPESWASVEEWVPAALLEPA
jgi:hypothetical protein